MGYSEITCTLCGVSFSLARIRTPSEPREYAWNYYSSGSPGTGFIPVDESCQFGEECSAADRDHSGQNGCMMAFREDQAVRSRGMRRRPKDKTWDERVFGGLKSERVDLGEDDADKDWAPEETSRDADSETDIEEMDYDFESGSGGFGDDVEMNEEEVHEFESCEDDARVESTEDDSGSDDGSEYLAWRDKVVTSTHLSVYGYPSCSRDGEVIERLEKLRCLTEEFRAKVPIEVKLPLHVSLDSLEEPLRSEVKKGDHDDYTVTQNDKVVVSPILNNPLNALGLDLECWEHLAGPDCRSTRAYHGSRISAEEMLNCNVAQGILLRGINRTEEAGSPDKDVNTTWETESTDEDWEGKGEQGWYLTGLADDIGCREDGSKDPYPCRHSDGNRFLMDCMHFEYVEAPYAMSFHPTCLEVFKRASLRRHGTFDINALGNWWKSVAEYNYMVDFPRAEDVRRGSDQWWNHEIGSEYLAANPCFVPPLKKILESSQRTETKNTTPRTSASLLSTLPVEIQESIMSYLDLVNVALLSVACPDLCTHKVMRKGLLNEMPHLWELWCSMPYSRWTGTTAAAIRAGIDAFDEQETEIARVLDVLEEEGYHDERVRCKQYWDDNREDRKKESRFILQEKPVDFVDVQKLDLAQLVLKLNEARTGNDLKGLRNRGRIWIDCNLILDRIAELQEAGTIPPPS